VLVSGLQLQQLTWIYARTDYAVYHFLLLDRNYKVVAAAAFVHRRSAADAATLEGYAQVLEEKPSFVGEPEHHEGQHIDL
jgi:hypothetical protein